MFKKEDTKINSGTVPTGTKTGIDIFSDEDDSMLLSNKLEEKGQAESKLIILYNYFHPVERFMQKYIQFFAYEQDFNLMSLDALDDLSIHQNMNEEDQIKMMVSLRSSESALFDPQKVVIRK